MTGVPHPHKESRQTRSQIRVGPFKAWKQCFVGLSVGCNFRMAGLLIKWRCGFQQGYVIGFPNSGQGEGQGSPE